MSRLPPHLLRLFFALVLCLQSGLATAHCLRMAGSSLPAPFPVAICTPEGILTLDLAQPGDPAHPQQAAHEVFCPFCHGTPKAPAPMPPGLPGLTIGPHSPPPAALHPAVPPGMGAAPYQPTGPPALA